MRKNLLFIFCILCMASYSLQGQICDGNLGENIFESGDFGSGTANFLTQDPNIAPSFAYSIHPPPHDGEYTITNNMALWNSVFPTWLAISDNSDDPNGYMMVVNASYSPGLFYEQEITDLCGNTLYEFSVDVINLIKTGTNIIQPNISFLLDGVEVHSTGNIPEDQQWKTYGFTFVTADNQNTLTLSLRNNAPGGNGNDLALDNITFRPCGPEAFILPQTVSNICENGAAIELDATIIGDQYDHPAVQWQESFDGGFTWVDIVGATDLTYLHISPSSGIYYYRYLLASDASNLQNSKCRIVSNTKIFNILAKFHPIIDTLCIGLSLSVGNNQYENTGHYTDSLISSFGCDSIVLLDLTILPDPQMEINLTFNEPSCSEAQDGSLILEEVINGASPFNILFEETSVSTSGLIPNLSQGEYAFNITDRHGCSLDTVVTLSSPTPLFLDLGPDIAVELGEQVHLTVNQIEIFESYTWTPDFLNDCTGNCLNPWWLPTQSTPVSITATDINNCMVTDSVQITVTANRQIFIPNAFSPNADGINDWFTISGPSILAIDQLQIFDRWGGLIHEQKQFAPNINGQGWDGTFNNKPLGSGVYVYHALVRFLDNKVIMYSGSISLVR